jgi:transketolase
MQADITFLQEMALVSRKTLLEIVSQSKAAHLGSSLSAIEIFLTCQYVSRPGDKIVVSKGHAAAGFYATMHALGKIDKETIETYGKNGTKLFGHITQNDEIGIEFSTGSLGHGLPYGIGVCLGWKLSGSKGRVFVVCSDGEMDEGTTWESALLANHNNLENLVLLVDRNGIQSLRATEETLKLEPLSKKWEAFGWDVAEVDGHDFEALVSELEKDRGGPKIVIAKTVKGKGISFMEGDNKWHYKPPNESELSAALYELANKNEK